MTPEAALERLREQSMELKANDEAKLSPLLHGHINVLGHYSFILSKQIIKGHLRPLNLISDTVIIP